MVRALAFSAFLLSSLLAASAQAPAPSGASVRMTEAQLRETLTGFVKSLAAPTPLTRKLARWESGICPLTVGQPPAAASFINGQLHAIAAAAGAPTGKKAGHR